VSGQGVENASPTHTSGNGITVARIPDTYGYSIHSNPRRWKAPALLHSRARPRLGIPFLQTGMMGAPRFLYTRASFPLATRSGVPCRTAVAVAQAAFTTLSIYEAVLYHKTERDHSTFGTPQCGCSDRLADNIALAQQPLCYISTTSYIPVCTTEWTTKRSVPPPFPFSETKRTEDLPIERRSLTGSGPP
jgi:hypothetical protein